MKNFLAFKGAFKSRIERTIQTADVNGFGTNQTILLNGSNSSIDAAKVAIDAHTTQFGNFGGNTKRAALNTNGEELFCIVQKNKVAATTIGNNVKIFDDGDVTGSGGHGGETKNTFIDTGTTHERGKLYKVPVAGLTVAGDGNSVVIAKHTNANGVTLEDTDIVTIGLASAKHGDGFFPSITTNPVAGGHGTPAGAGFGCSKEFGIIYPEDALIGVRPIAENASKIIFKNINGAASQDVITVVHAANKHKQVANLVEAAANNGNMYQGMTTVIDTSGDEANCFLRKNDAGITDISIVFGV